MTDMENISQTTQTVFASFKKIFSLIKDRKWFAASKEIFIFIKLVYTQHLKGKYFTIKGKQVPRTLVAVLAVLGAYFITPSTDNNHPKEQSIAEAANVKKETNTFDEKGVKVYDMRKCDNAACGIIENYGDNNFEKITINLSFHAPSGIVIYEGGVEASGVESHTRMKINVPCPDEFAYFKLKEVVLE